MFIRSERLFLRPGWPEDWTELLAAIADEGVVRNLARAPWPYTMEDAMAFARRPQAHRYPHFLITVPGAQGARIVGCAGLAPSEHETELGYWIARGYWGQGYATEAVRAVLRLAETLGHRRVVASHFADNPASGRVLLKSGFRRTGDRSGRFGLARGETVASLRYAIELGISCGQDDDGMMRAA